MCVWLREFVSIIALIVAHLSFARATFQVVWCVWYLRVLRYMVHEYTFRTIFAAYLTLLNHARTHERETVKHTK